MAETDFEARRDPIEIGRRSSCVKFQGVSRSDHGTPCLLVRADQHAAAFLPHVDLALEVDDVQQFAPELTAATDFRHFAREHVLLLHREHRKLEARPSARPRGPEPAGIDDVLAWIVPLSVTMSHPPSSPRDQLDDAREPIDLGLKVSRGLRVGIRDAGGVDVAFQRVVQRADEVALVEQREEALRSSTEMISIASPGSAPGAGEPQEIHPLGGSGQVDAAGDVQRRTTVRTPPRSPSRA
jgi:hypothetical protein